MVEFRYLFPSVLSLLMVGGAAQAASLMQSPMPVPTACDAGPQGVMVPCEHMGWNVGAEFIYVQPAGGSSFSNNDSLDWAPGLKLSAAYLFDSGNDVNVNWTYFGHTSKRDGVPVPALPSIPRDEHVKDRFHALNAEFGQTVHWSSAVSSRFHAGMQYVHFKRDTSFTLELPLPYNEIYAQKFQGFGPRVGIESEYAIADSGISLFGEAAGSLLLGNAKYTDQIDPSTNNSVRKIVPGVETRMGGRYTWELGQQSISFEGGYQWAGYIDSIQDSLGNQSNYGYHGLFLGLSWRGDLFAEPGVWK